MMTKNGDKEINMIKKLFQRFPNLQKLCIGVFACSAVGVIIVGGITLEIQRQEAEQLSAFWSEQYKTALDTKQELEGELLIILERFAFVPSSFNRTGGAGGAEIVSAPLTPVSDLFLSQELEGEALFRFPVAESDFLRYTSLHGERISPFLNVLRTHLGVDITTRVPRAQVISAANGVVVEHWPAPGAKGPNGIVFRGHPVYGGMIIIEHENGWRTLYAHLSETFVNVHARRKVKEGQVIGRIGNSGRSTGYHLHFEIQRPGGESVNPLLYLPDPFLVTTQ